MRYRTASFLARCSSPRSSACVGSTGASAGRGSCCSRWQSCLTLVAANELLAMFRHRGHDPTAWAIYVGTLLTVSAAGAPGISRSTFVTKPAGRLGWLAIGLGLSLLVAAIVEMRRFDRARFRDDESRARHSPFFTSAG